MYTSIVYSVSVLIKTIFSKNLNSSRGPLGPLGFIFSPLGFIFSPLRFILGFILGPLGFILSPRA